MNLSSPNGNGVGTGIGYKEFDNAHSQDYVMPQLPFGNNYTSVTTSTGVPTMPPASTQLQPQQVIIIQAPKMQRSFAHYPDRWSLVCGAIQIAAGIVSIILGIANAPTCALLGIIGYGIWCGVIFIVSGSFGIVSSRNKTSCTIVSHMVMSVISAIAAAVQFSLGVSSAAYDFYSFSPPTTGCYYAVGQYQPGDDIGPDGAVSTDALLAVVAIVEAVVAIIGSAVSCKVICCSSKFVPAQGAAVGGYPSAQQQHQQQYGPGSMTQAQIVYYVNQQPSAGAAVQSQQQFPVAYGQNTGYGY